MSNDKRRHSKCCPNQNSNIRKISENWKFCSKYLRPKFSEVLFQRFVSPRLDCLKVLLWTGHALQHKYPDRRMDRQIKFQYTFSTLLL